MPQLLVVLETTIEGAMRLVFQDFAKGSIISQKTNYLCKNIFMIRVINFFAIVAFFFLASLSTSCYTQRHIGCTKKEVRQSAKHFKKSVNWCNVEAMRQSLIYFPFKEIDSSWSDYKRGVDTFWRMSDPIKYDCDEFIRQRDSLAKLGVKTEKKASVKCPDSPYTIDTINKYKSTIKEDSRNLGILQGQLDIAAQKEADMAVELSEKNVKIAVLKQGKSNWMWLSISLMAVIASWFGIKYVIPIALKKGL